MKHILSKLLLFTSIAQTAFSVKAQDTSCSQVPAECKAFTLLDGEIQLDTPLWFLGEHHSFRELTLKCIEYLTKNVKNHIIYLEGQEAGKKVSCPTAYPGLTDKPGRICKGWDDVEALDETTSQIENTEQIKKSNEVYINLMIFKEKYKEYQLEGINDKGFDRILKAMKIDQAKVKKNKHQPAYKQQEAEINVRTTDWLLNQRKKGYSYTEVFSNLHKVFGESGKEQTTVVIKDVAKSQKSFKKRQKVLARTIQRHPAGHFGIFVAGKDHLDGETRKAIAELAHENTYAVLSTLK